MSHADDHRCAACQQLLTGDAVIGTQTTRTDYDGCTVVTVGPKKLVHPMCVGREGWKEHRPLNLDWPG